ncbi:histidine kinase [Pseudomonas phage vB_Pa-PAC8]
MDFKYSVCFCDSSWMPATANQSANTTAVQTTQAPVRRMASGPMIKTEAARTMAPPQMMKPARPLVMSMQNFFIFWFLRSRNGWDLELGAAEDINDDLPERRNRPLITVEVGFRIDSQGYIGSGRPFVNGAFSHESGHSTVTERIRPVRNVSRHRVLLSSANDKFLPLAQTYRAYRLPTATATGLASRRVLIPFMSQFTEARRTVNVIVYVLHRPNQNQGLEIESMIVDGRVMEAKPARQLRMPYMEAACRKLDLDEAQAVQRDFVLHRISDGIHVESSVAEVDGKGHEGQAGRP